MIVHLPHGSEALKIPKAVMSFAGGCLISDYATKRRCMAAFTGTPSIQHRHMNKVQ